MRRGLLLIASLLIVGLLVWLVCFAQKPTAPAALGQKWHEQVYGLDEGEVVRLIPPPYTPQRMQDPSLNINWVTQLGFAVYGKDQLHGIDRSDSVDTRRRSYLRGMFNGNWLGFPARPKTSGDLQAALEYCELGRGTYVSVPQELRGLTVDGDWMVRGDIDLDRRLVALRSILRAVTGKDLIPHYYIGERDVEDDWSLRLVSDPDQEETDYKLEKLRESVVTFSVRQVGREAKSGGEP